MYLKELASTLAICLSFIAFFPYIRGILRNEIKPHVFSWAIWGITTFVVFLAQLQDEGGLGAWPTGVSGIITFVIATLAFLKRADISVTATDWIFLAVALSSLPLWYFSSEAMLAVVMLTTIDLLGFGPTARKAWHAPWTESLWFFFLYINQNLLALVALENYSITTVLFPAAVASACTLMLLLVYIRRRQLAGQHNDANR